MKKLIELIDLPVFGDERGSLIALESHKNIPFEIKRTYCIFDTKEGVSRGFHAHKNLNQIAVCLIGKCRMVLDDGMQREEVWLDAPTKGVHIGKLIWREMHDFTEDCVLMVLADQHYDPEDYIKDYPEFLECANHVPTIENN